MSYKNHALALVLVFLSVSSAWGMTDPLAGCGKPVSETDFNASGAKLKEIVPPDLTHFPVGFLKDCSGNDSYTAVVKMDGSVRMLGADHGVSCGHFGDDLKQTEALFRSVEWHRDVLGRRVQAMRFAQPVMNGKPVCVWIGFAWDPKTPNRFLSSGWSTH